MVPSWSYIADVVECMTESARIGALLQSKWDRKTTTAQLADFLNVKVKSVAASQVRALIINIFRGILQNKILCKC